MIAGESREHLRELATERLGLAPSALVEARIDDALARLSAAGASTQALASLPFDTPLWQSVVEALTIGETNFFRQPAWFAQIERQILSPLIEHRRIFGPKRLRVWSAGCATGEEAYSLAILITRLLRRSDELDVGIIATDLSTAFLAEARRGVYREWSLRELDAATRMQHFRKLDSGRFELGPVARALVTFEPFNLADNEGWDDPRRLDFDLIVCRNVLIYLARERQRAVAQHLIAGLASDGWLATAPAEATAEWFQPLIPVNVPSAVLFHRDDAAALHQRERTPLPHPERRRAATSAESPARRKTDLSNSAAALAAARIALDSSIRRSGE